MSTEPQPQPERRRADDFPREVLALFDEYVHGGIDRRRFLERTTQYAAAAGTTAAALLAALSPDFAAGEQVPRNDSRVRAQTVEFPSAQGYGTGRAYVASPKPPAAPGSKLPVVLVIHENRGLNPHIEDIARRLALANFIAVAPDALFPLGGYPGDEDKAREAFVRLDPAKTREDMVAAAKFAQTLPGGNGKLGATGFCWGGGIVNMLATRLPGLGAAVPFYGEAPPLAEVPKIKSPLLLMFAENDPRINTGWGAYDAALRAAGVPHQAFMYPGTQHGFNNDTTPRFDAPAAALAWQRTLAFFEQNLRNA